jgi:hypothetical protein
VTAGQEKEYLGMSSKAAWLEMALSSAIPGQSVVRLRVAAYGSHQEVYSLVKTLRQEKQHPKLAPVPRWMEK